MLNANNKVNYETSVKQKEKKYSLSTVLAWIYLKTIGRILPGRWNKWAENLLHYNIADNGVQTDDLLNSDRAKELKDEIKRLEEKLKEGSKKEENQSNLNQELTKKEKEITELKEQVKLLEEEKEGKISSLTQLNEVLEQEKKEMETKNNEQKQTIIEEEKRIREQEDLIKSFHENKDINETVKKENENLQAQNTELESKFSQLKNESDTKINQLESQLKEKQAELEQAKKRNTEFRKKLESAQQQLEQEKTNLNATETEKKDLEGGVKELKEKLQILEKNSAKIEKQKTDLEKKLEFSQGKNKKLQEQVEHLSQEREKATSIAISSVENNVETLSETLKNQQIESSIAEGRQQKLKNEQKDAGKKSEGMNKKTKAQAKTKEVDTVSTVSIAKSTASKILKSSKNFFVNKNLEDFLSDQNTKLKKSFPEFKEKHFCHNVLKETIQSLVYQNGYKFKSDKLLALLEENLVQSGRAIIETKVNEVVEELAKDFVKKHDLKQVIFVEECAKELYLNEKDGKAILNSFTGFLAQGNVSNNDSVKNLL